MMIIKKIDPVSAGKITGSIAAAFGLLFGVIFLMMTLLGGIAGGLANDGNGLIGAGIGFVGGLFLAILMPVFYGAIGFIGGLLQAFLFNIATRYVGGLRVETE